MQALSISLSLDLRSLRPQRRCGINLVRTKKPDIVLLDVVMDDVTGLEVLEQVRSFSQVPVIMFTGRAEIAAIATQLGANDFVVKPFDPDLLLEKIRLSLGARRTA
jgi:DNA-binding response OmpR family regulator